LTESTELPALCAVRLQLRHVRPADLQDLYALFSDPAVMRYWSTPPMTCITQAQKYLTAIWRGQHQGTLFQWAIARLDDDRLIGTCTLFGLDLPNGRAEIGYALRHDHWGGGWAYEALTQVCTHVFDVLKLRRLEADVDPRNPRSLQLLQRLGFVREGLLRERWEVAGELQDSVVLGLLQRDRPAR
jgi:RimJ/RimL family protein N-acetyltransferase